MYLPVKTTLFTLVISVCLGAVIWMTVQLIAEEQDTLVVSTQPIDDSSKAETLQQQLAALYSRLGQLENNQQQILVLSQRMAKLEQSHHSLVQELRQEIDEHDPDTAALTDDQSSNANDERMKDEIARFEDSFWQETEDPTWSLETETSMVKTLEELQVADTMLDGVQCQESACRIEFLHPKGTGNETLIESVHATEAFNSEFYAESIVESDGQRRTVVYLSRPGEALFSSHNP